MMALIITPEDSSRAETNHYTNSSHLDFEPCSNPCYIPQSPYIVSQTSTSVVIRTQEELDREEMEQPHIIRRRPTCRFMNTAFFKDLKAIGGAEDLEEQQRYIEGEEYEEEYGEEYREEYGGDEEVLYEGEGHRPVQLNPLGNDLPPGHDPPLGFGHPSWEPIGDLAVQEAEEIISSLEMIPELPEPQDDQSDNFLYTQRNTGPEFSESRDNRSNRVQYIGRTISALSGELERPGPGESHSQVSQSQSQSDEWLTASDASSRTSWVTHVTSEHRPLWGETKPIGTKLIVSRLNEHERNDPEGLDLYYLPDLKEWRPFPVEVEIWNAPEPVQVLKKKSKVKRFASAVVTRIKCGTYGHHIRAPLDKRLISMPVEGSKRGMIEALLDDK